MGGGSGSGGILVLMEKRSKGKRKQKVLVPEPRLMTHAVVRTTVHAADGSFVGTNEFLVTAASMPCIATVMIRQVRIVE